MKAFIIVGVILAALFQVNARSIGQNDEMPKVLSDTIQQSFSCAMQLGPQVSSIPKIVGVAQLPENNPALNQLWGCIWEKKGIINRSAEVNEQKLEDYLLEMASMFGEVTQENKNTAHEMVHDCVVIDDNDYGLRAVKIQNCINRYIENHPGS